MTAQKSHAMRPPTVDVVDSPGDSDALRREAERQILHGNPAVAGLILAHKAKLEDVGALLYVYSVALAVVEHFATDGLPEGTAHDASDSDAAPG